MFKYFDIKTSFLLFVSVAVSGAVRRACCAAVVALRPATFGSLPVASVATLRSGRESTTGVLRLKDERPPGLVG